MALFRLFTSLLFIAAALLLPLEGQAQTSSNPVVLRLFAGGKAQRPDLLRQVLDEYQRRHPEIQVNISVGAATSELQRKYLSILLNAGDDSYDAILIDVVNPPLYAAAGWIEALDSYLPDREELLRAYLPVYTRANLVGGKLVALPAQAGAMFLFYRKDLLEQYGIAPPSTWAQLAAAARLITAGEARPELQGLSIQGAPIEGTVCTFLLPYWSQGRDILDATGHLSLDRSAAVAGLRLWQDLIAQGVLKRNIAEVTTMDTVNDFKAGNVVFALNWGQAWQALEEDSDSRVRGRVGVQRIPSVTGGLSATCIGGWQWALSAHSRHKPETVALLRYLASSDVSKFFALEGSQLPIHQSLYRDAEILARLPWLRLAEPVLLSANSRPVTPRYGEVSSTLRTVTSSVLGGSLTPEAGVDEIHRRLERILR
jgi:multiple sugar transport system substrate-binding protein